jgi:poly(3-hydroxybutyrate) depolymerase
MVLGSRNFSPWAQWMARLEATSHEDPFPGYALEDLEHWRHRRRERLTELLGRFPERVPLSAQVVETVACDAYQRDKVVFDTEDTMSVPAYLLRPYGAHRRRPAVLALHGHGPGKAEICGLTATTAPGGHYAVELAERGFVVLAPDLRCFGERWDALPPSHYACDTNLVHALMAGWVPLTQNLWDLMRCIDLLQEDESVDPARIGVAGFSYGGTMSLFLAAYDQRVAAAVVSGYVSSWASSHAVPLNMCGSQVLPGMLGRLEHLDVASLIAPRPLLVETGVDDPLFSRDAAVTTVERLRGVYSALGAPGHLLHDLFSGGHQWHGEAAYPFLVRHLTAEGGP